MLVVTPRQWVKPELCGRKYLGSVQSNCVPLAKLSWLHDKHSADLILCSLIPAETSNAYFFVHVRY